MHVVKFKTVFVKKCINTDKRIEELKRWCKLFSIYKLMPIVGGRAMGNISFRISGNKFIITASGLKNKKNLLDNDFVKVVACDTKNMLIYVHGIKEPSSETMLHYSIYEKRKDINAIFHGHSEEIVKNYKKLNLVITKKFAPSGTIKLVNEVIKVLDNNNFIVIREHGFLSIGKNINDAGNLTLKILDKIRKK